MTPTNFEKIVLDLWWASRFQTEADVSCSTRHGRMLYVKQQLVKNHAELISDLSPKKLWQEIEYITSPTH